MNKKTIVSDVSAERTADGERFDPAKLYYFYDTGRREVISSISLRARDGFLCALGYRVIPIQKLRADRRDALNDAQEAVRGEIKDRLMFIGRLETEKART
jgi:hypothetical protein